MKIIENYENLKYSNTIYSPVNGPLFLKKNCVGKNKKDEFPERRTLIKPGIEEGIQVF